MLIKFSGVLIAIGLSTSAAAQWQNPWCDSSYCDDNESNGHRQEPDKDVVDTENSRGQLQNDRMIVEVGTTQVTDYARICEYIGGVKLKNANDTLLTEKEYLNAQVVRANRSKTFNVPFELADSPGFKFVKDSIIMHSTCLRYTKEGYPKPSQNPDDVPSQMPNKLCNPDLSMGRGCGNDQRADGNSQEPWPNASQWWE